METGEGQPGVIRKGYKEVPIQGNTINFRTDCQRGDIVWWKSESGNKYEFEIKDRSSEDSVWTGELRDQRMYRNPAPVAEVWGDPETYQLGLNVLAKGKRVTFSVKPAKVKGRRIPDGVFDGSVVQDFGILRKEPGKFAKLLKR